MSDHADYVSNGLGKYTIYTSLGGYHVTREGGGVLIIQKSTGREQFLQGEEAAAFEALMDRDELHTGRAYTADDACGEYF